MISLQIDSEHLQDVGVTIYSPFLFLLSFSFRRRGGFFRLSTHFSFLETPILTCPALNDFPRLSLQISPGDSDVIMHLFQVIFPCFFLCTLVESPNSAQAALDLSVQSRGLTAGRCNIGFPASNRGTCTCDPYACRGHFRDNKRDTSKYVNKDTQAAAMALPRCACSSGRSKRKATAIAA